MFDDLTLVQEVPVASTMSNSAMTRAHNNSFSIFPLVFISCDILPLDGECEKPRLSRGFSHIVKLNLLLIPSL
jgi:hypothetical protein